ncbi:phage tail protein [Ferrimonas balearica]|uniref:phage tail protein n=1 Tax=Ferrimonas balearica TaxID=44012 RepID=UPI001C9718CE|nr:phage tail protein [Ferrimonas balearica]MBY6223551.1 hypothetical protein [Ferrimonas balearica]
MPPVVVGIAAGVAAAGVVSTAAAIAIGVGAAALTYAATEALTANSFANEAYAQQRMVRSPTEPRRGIYGRAMVSGPLVFAEETGEDNAYLHLVIPLAGHPCDGVEAVYFGDELAWRNGQLQRRFAGKARIKAHLGRQTSADADLVRECQRWGRAHIGKGMTYLYVRLQHDPDVYPNGVPNIKALVRGKRVYDPRRDSSIGGDGEQRWDTPATWAWSENWALCVLDFTRFESGVGANASEIDLPSFAAAANDSDEAITYQDGQTESRYCCNGTWTQDSSPSSVMERLLTAGAGTFVYVSGRYRLYAGVYQGPETLTLTEADAAGEVSVRPYTPRAELCNAVRGTYVDPDNFYQPSDFPPHESAYYRQQDNNEYIDHDLDLPFTQSLWTAQRLAKLHLELNRAGMRVQFPTKMIGLAVSVGSVVRLQMDRLGIDGVFQVVDWQMELGKPVRLILQESNAALYDFAQGEYTQRDLAPNTVLPRPAQVPAPVDLAIQMTPQSPHQDALLRWSPPVPVSSASHEYDVTLSRNGKAVQSGTTWQPQYAIARLDAGQYLATVATRSKLFGARSPTATLAFTLATPSAPTHATLSAASRQITVVPHIGDSQISFGTTFVYHYGTSEERDAAQYVGKAPMLVLAGLLPDTEYHLWIATETPLGRSQTELALTARTTLVDADVLSYVDNTVTRQVAEATGELLAELDGVHKLVEDADALAILQALEQGMALIEAEKQAQNYALFAEHISRISTESQQAVTRVETLAARFEGAFAGVQESQRAWQGYSTKEDGSTGEATTPQHAEQLGETWHPGLALAESVKRVGVVDSDGNSVQLIQLMQALQSEQGALKARAFFGIDENGRVSGIGITSDGETDFQAINLSGDAIGFSDPDDPENMLVYWDSELQTFVIKGRLVLADGHTISQQEDIQGERGDKGDPGTPGTAGADGQDGAGLYSLANSTGTWPGDATATTLFRNAYGRNPVRGDVLTFYKTGQSATASTKQCTTGGTSAQWGSPSFVVHGSMVATGTISGDRLMAGTTIRGPQLELVGSSHMRIISQSPFGSNRQFVDWFGPRSLDANGEPRWRDVNEIRAVQYLKADGSAYFGGTLSAGADHSAVHTSLQGHYQAGDLLTVGPYASRGNQRKVVVSHSYQGSYTHSGRCPTGTPNPRLQWRLYRRINGGSWSLLTTQSFTGQFRANYEQGTCYQGEHNGGSYTFTDNHSASGNVEYKLRVVSHQRAMHTSNVQSQITSLTVTEE